MKKFFISFALFAALILVVSCGGGSSNNRGDNNQNNNQSSDVCEYGEYECHGENSYFCDESDSSDDLMWLLSETCSNGCDSSTGKCNSNSTDNTEQSLIEEGLYFGIIGFNTELYVKNIGLLDKSTVNSYTNFIDNELHMGEYTALYYADYIALEKMRNFQRPPKLDNVALITFTDGMDNASSGERDPQNYDDPYIYRDALHNMIVNEKIHGKKVAAYTIGLESEGSQEFLDTLDALASEPADNYRFNVSNMEDVQERFKKIAERLYKVTQKVNLNVEVGGNYGDGWGVRFTFDIYCDPFTQVCEKQGEYSELYIEATYRRSGDERSLENITYKGFVAPDKDHTAIQGTLDEISKVAYHFVFEDIKYDESKNPLSKEDYANIQMWKKPSDTWAFEKEFNRDSKSELKEDKKSALIMLVLDSTISLGNTNFNEMKVAAKDFIATLVNGASTTGGDSTTMSECSKDSATGLTWSKKTGSTVTWNDAIGYCNNLTECGYSDWKLPIIDDLRTLLIADRVSNNCRVSEANGCLSYNSCWSCSTCTQTGTQANSGTDCAGWGSSYSDGRYSKFGDSEYFWSSSSVSSLSDGSGSAWNVDFGNGSIYDAVKSNGGYVRCVR